MSRTLRYLVVLALLLGGLALWRGLPREDSVPPDRPADQAGAELPGSGDGASTPAPGEEEAASAGEARIVRGQIVTGEDEMPVPGARVLVFDAPQGGDVEFWLPTPDAPEPAPVQAQTVSAKDGTFKVRVPSGISDVLRLIARAQGFREGYGCEYEPGDDVSILLERDSFETWRVEDLAECAVVGAEVLIYGQRVDGLPRLRLVTDDRGRCRASVGAGDEILIRKSGFASAWCDLSSPKSRVVVLSPEFPLAGLVSDTRGRPVEGAEVLLSTWPRTRRITRADGRFSFNGLRGDSAPWVSVTAPGFVEVKWMDVSPGREDVAVVLLRPEELPEKGSVPVRVTLPEGVKATRTRFEVVHLPDRESTWYDLGESRMEAEGIFVLTNILPGEHEILSEYGIQQMIPYQAILKTIPRYRGTARFRVEGGKEAPLVMLRLKDIGASYACIRVLDAAGRPAEELRLHCETPGLGRFTKNHHWYTSPSGKIVTAVEAPPGTTVTYTAYPYRQHEGIPTTAQVTTVATAAGPFTDLVLKPGARLSIAVLGPDGKPLSKETGLRVETLQDGFPEWIDGFQQLYSGRGRSGPFETSLLPNRPFTLRISTARHAAHLQSFSAPGKGKSEIEVRLADAAHVSGRLLTPGGASPGEVSIRVLDENGRDVVTDHQTGTGESFRTGALPAGRMTFVAESRDRALVAVCEVVLSAGGNLDLGDVTMRPMDRIRGTVLSTDGRPASGVEIALRRADSNGDLMTTVTRMDGTFEVARAFCTRPLLVARTPDGSAKALVTVSREEARGKITVQLLATAEVFARFEPPVSVRRSEPRLSVEAIGGVRCFPRSAPVWTEDNRLAGYRLRQVPPGDLAITFEGRLVNGRPLSAEARITVKPGETRETLLR